MATKVVPGNAAPCPDCSGEWTCPICGGTGVISPEAARIYAEDERQRDDERGVWEDPFDDGGPA